MNDAEKEADLKQIFFYCVTIPAIFLLLFLLVRKPEPEIVKIRVYLPPNSSEHDVVWSYYPDSRAATGTFVLKPLNAEGRFFGVIVTNKDISNK